MHCSNMILQTLFPEKSLFTLVTLVPPDALMGTVDMELQVTLAAVVLATELTHLPIVVMILLFVVLQLG